MTAQEEEDDPVDRLVKWARLNGPVHLWFNLSYSNYMVWQRTLMQSMPVDWQRRFVELADELEDAFDHLVTPRTFKVQAAEEVEVDDLTSRQRAFLDVQKECEDVEEDDGDVYEDCTYYDAHGNQLDSTDRVLIPVEDPIPGYNRGRTYLPPRLRVTDGQEPEQ